MKPVMKVLLLPQEVDPVMRNPGYQIALIVLGIVGLLLLIYAGFIAFGLSRI